MKKVKTVSKNPIDLGFKRQKILDINRADLSYQQYKWKESLSRYKHHILPFLSLFIAIGGLILIDSQFAPIQTPNEILSRQANLINMCTLMIMINLWGFMVRRIKIPIFR